ncbi:hypothetical protein RAS1_40320 [Phycisphaerae bacterium RAS1]|nr:hypothetical protein RAS1_40320 [Phycisphaerae bacterium RAS1]
MRTQAFRARAMLPETARSPAGTTTPRRRLCRCFIGMIAAAAIGALDAHIAAADAISQAALLRRIADFDRLMTPPPVGEQARVFGGDGAAASGSAGDGWTIAARIDGPGAMTHLWVADSASAEIRIAIDGATVVEGPAGRLVDGSLAPLAPPFCVASPGGGAWCRFPLGFSKSCEVSFRRLKGAYSVGAVQFAPGTAVEPFRRPLSEEAEAARREIGRLLEESQPTSMPADAADLLQSPVEDHVLRNRRTYAVASQKSVGAGESMGETLEKAGVVRALYVALTDRSNPRALYALHRCTIRIHSDGRSRADVECPLIDFFGAAFDYAPYNSLPMGTQRYLNVPLPERRIGQDYYLYCYYPIPFSKGAALEIHNGGDESIGLMVYLRVDRAAPPEGALRFRAGFRREDPCNSAEFTAIETSGRGRLVGCTLGVDCPREAWWGAGAVLATADRGAPLRLGSDIAAYFGDAAPLRAWSGALAGVTRHGAYGKQGAFRWHIGDDIPFQKSLRLSFGNRQDGGRQDVFYSAVVYWYGEPEGATPKALRGEDLAVWPLRIPNAVEIEGRVSGEDWGAILSQKNVPDMELSGGGAVALKENVKVTVTVPAKRAGEHRVKLRVRPRRPFGTIEVSSAAGDVIGRAVYERTSDGVYDIGILTLKEGLNELGVQSDALVLLDCWILEPK